MEGIFDEFVGKEIKAVIRDIDTFKITRGILTAQSTDFIKIKGKLGTMIVYKDTIEKLGLKA